uniref:Uncharacterized protein n=1 Tax=Cacopsylla melanoneura TaxID=428564 RepID=A0A8D8S3J2_9HEMI
MLWCCILILTVFVFTKVKTDVLPSPPDLNPDPLSDYYDEIGDYYHRFTTVSIFQAKFFPHDDPNLLLMLRKHLENPNARRKSMVKIANAFDRDKKKHKQQLEKDHVQGLHTKIWPSLIPTGYMSTPEFFFDKIQENRQDGKVLCHLCLVYVRSRDHFHRHYMRHFVPPNATGKTRRIRRTTRKTIVTTKPTSSLSSNGSVKIKRRVLRTKTTVIT